MNLGDVEKLRFAAVTLVAVALLLINASPASSFGFTPGPSLHHLLARPRVVVNHAASQRNGSFFKRTFLSMSEAAAGVTAETPVDDKDPPLFEGIFKGITRDYKMRLPYFKSDITDGINIQCLAATLFLFFACLSPAIGFGALFGTATNGAIGTIEMVFSTALCGVVYALTSAQPLTIIGSTGPVLAFVAALVQLADKMSLPFLPLYAWTGIWTSGILLAR